MSEVIAQKPDKHEELKSEVEKLTKTFDDVQNAVARDRAAFFERLALLSGGSIALSLSLLGYLQSTCGKLISGTLVLHLAWGFLLFCLIATLVRNFQHQSYYFYQLGSLYWDKRADLVMHNERIVRDKSKILLDELSSPFGEVERNVLAEQLARKSTGLRTESARSRTLSDKALKVWMGCERAALVAFVIGITLLVSFAVFNSPCR